jgi:SSS family solute:Na+ symporter
LRFTRRSSAAPAVQCGLIGACVVTSVWYLLGDPFGINNMYIALLTPAVIMAIDRLIPGKAQGKAPTPQNNGV